MSIAAPWRPVTSSTVPDSVVHSWYLCMHININIFFKHNHFCLWCHCSEGPLKCFISLNNKTFFCFRFFCRYFHLLITETPRHSSFFSGIICGPSWGSFVVLGSLAVHDLGIICGRGSFAVSGSFATLDSPHISRSRILLNVRVRQWTWVFYGNKDRRRPSGILSCEGRYIP